MKCTALCASALLLLMVTFVSAKHGGFSSQSSDTVEAVLHDGSATAELSALFTPTDCNEVYSSWKLDTNQGVLTKDDVMVTSDYLDLKGPSCGGSSVFNVTLEFMFDKLPGKFDGSFTLVTELGDKYVSYELDFAVNVYGVAMLAGGTIVSGSGAALNLSDDALTANRQTTLDVVSNLPTGADLSSAVIKPVDSSGGEWSNYFPWDSSCPAVLGSNTSECGAGFSSDYSQFIIHSGYARVGCGGYVVDISVPDAEVDGQAISTSLNVKTSMSSDPPVVAICKKFEADYYGNEMFKTDVYNLVKCGSKASDVVGSMTFGQSSWNVEEAVMGAVQQTLSLVSSVFDAADITVSVSGGKITVTPPGGSPITIPVATVCDGIGSLAANVHSTDLVSIAKDFTTGSDSLPMVVEIGVPRLSAKTMSKYRSAKYAAALRGDSDTSADGVVSSMSTASFSNGKLVSRAEVCESRMCQLKNLVRDRLWTMRSSDDGVVVKMNIAVATSEYEDRQKEILAMGDSFGNAVNGYDVSILSAGPPPGVEVPKGPALGTGIIVGIVLGVLGLLLFLLVILFMVFSDRDAATTVSDWSEGGVSVDGVPVPSSRYYDAVVVDSYGRGDGAATLRDERPTAAE